MSWIVFDLVLFDCDVFVFGVAVTSCDFMLTYVGFDLDFGVCFTVNFAWVIVDWVQISCLVWL